MRRGLALGVSAGRDHRMRSEHRRSCVARLARRKAITASSDTWRVTGRAEHGPAELVPGTIRVVTVRMDYLRVAEPIPMRSSAIRSSPTSRGTPSDATITGSFAGACSASPIRLNPEAGAFGYRAFVDSAHR